MNTAGNGLPLPHSPLATGQLEAVGQLPGQEKEDASLLQFQLSKSACSETGLEIFAKKEVNFCKASCDVESRARKDPAAQRC